MQNQPGQQPQTPAPDQGQPQKQRNPELDAATAALATVIYRKGEPQDAIVNALRKGGDKPTAFGNLAAQLTIKVDQKMGNKMPEGIILPAATVALRSLNEVAETEGVGGLQSKQDKTRATGIMTKALSDHYQSGQFAKEHVAKAGEHGIRQAARAYAGGDEDEAGEAEETEAAEEQPAAQGGGLLSGGMPNGSAV